MLSEQTMNNVKTQCRHSCQTLSLWAVGVVNIIGHVNFEIYLLLYWKFPTMHIQHLAKI